MEPGAHQRRPQPLERKMAGAVYLRVLGWGRKQLVVFTDNAVHILEM
jgi:hypothetical protein